MGKRVFCGGSWSLNDRYARCACRLGNVPDYFDDSTGFQLFSPGLFLDSGS